MNAAEDYERAQTQTDKDYDELAAERAKQLEIENAELESQAKQLEKEISNKQASVFHP